MVQHKQGWAVYIRSSSIDLEDLRQALRQPFDPWVEDVGQLDGSTGLVLRSSTWDALTEPREVNAQAARLIDILNGAKPIQDADSEPYEMGGLVKFDSAGTPHYALIAATGNIKLGGCRVRGTAAVGDGEPSMPKESALQRWIKSAETDAVRAELFVHLGRLDNWFDIYKAAELIRKVAGGHHQLEKTMTATNDWDAFERIWQTANYRRHAPGLTNPLPNPPAELNEARLFLLTLTSRIV